MKSLLKIGLVLGAVTAGTVWAMHRYAPDKLEALRTKAADAVKKFLPSEVELTVESGDMEEEPSGSDTAPTLAPEDDPELASTRPEEELSAEDAAAEEWPDLSRLPEEPEKPEE